MLIFFWILLAIAVAMLASKRGRSGGRWFLISAVISPLLGFIFLLVSKDLSKDDGERIACPKCAEKILFAAKVCPHCENDLVNDVSFSAALKKHKETPAEERTNLLIGIGFIIGLIVVAKVISQV